MQRKVHIPLYLNAENKKYTCPTPALKISLHMLCENLHMASQIELLLEQINKLPVLKWHKTNRRLFVRRTHAFP